MNYEAAVTNYKNAVKSKEDASSTFFDNFEANNVTKAFFEKYVNSEAQDIYISNLENLIASIDNEAQKGYLETQLEKAKKEQFKISKELEDFVNELSLEQKEDLDKKGLSGLENTSYGEDYFKASVGEKFSKLSMEKAKQDMQSGDLAVYEALKNQREKIEEEFEKEKNSKVKETSEGNKISDEEKPTTIDPITKEEVPADENPDTSLNKMKEDGVYINEDVNQDEVMEEFSATIDNYAENTKLTHINGAAWISSNNRDNFDTDPDTIANSKKLAEIFENNSTNLSEYEVEFSIDEKYLAKRASEGYLIESAQLKALQEGTDIPLIGTFPIKGVLKHKGKTVINGAGNETVINIHNAHNAEEIMEFLNQFEQLSEDFKLQLVNRYTHHYNVDILPSAIVSITAQKQELLAAFKNGEVKKAGLSKQNQGYSIINKKDGINSFQNVTNLTNVNENSSLFIGNGVGLVDAEGNVDRSFINSPKPGSIYVKDNKGNVFPVKVPYITKEESSIVIEAYMELMEAQNEANAPLPETKPSKELMSNLRKLGNFSYLGKEPTLLDIINTFIFQGSKTAGNKNREVITFKDGNQTVLKINNKKFTLEELLGEGKDVAINELSSNKLRNVQRKYFNDKSYRGHILPKMITIFQQTPEGNMRVQPTITYEYKDADSGTQETSTTKIDAPKEAKIVGFNSKVDNTEAKRADIERRRQEELETRKNKIEVNRTEYTDSEGNVYQVREFEDGHAEYFIIPKDSSFPQNISSNGSNIYSKEYLEEVTGEDLSDGKLIEPKRNLVNKINAKYDAELKALESTETSQDFDTELASKIQAKLQELYPEIENFFNENPIYSFLEKNGLYMINHVSKGIIASDLSENEVLSTIKDLTKPKVEKPLITSYKAQLESFKEKAFNDAALEEPNSLAFIADLYVRGINGITNHSNPEISELATEALDVAISLQDTGKTEALSKFYSKFKSMIENIEEGKQPLSMPINEKTKEEITKEEDYNDITDNLLDNKETEEEKTTKTPLDIQEIETLKKETPSKPKGKLEIPSLKKKSDMFSGLKNKVEGKDSSAKEIRKFDENSNLNDTESRDNCKGTK
jgi:hypothetical protein